MIGILELENTDPEDTDVFVTRAEERQPHLSLDSGCPAITVSLASESMDGYYADAWLRVDLQEIVAEYIDDNISPMPAIIDAATKEREAFRRWNEARMLARAPEPRGNEINEDDVKHTPMREVAAVLRELAQMLERVADVGEREMRRDEPPEAAIA